MSSTGLRQDDDATEYKYLSKKIQYFDIILINYYCCKYPINHREILKFKYTVFLKFCFNIVGCLSYYIKYLVANFFDQTNFFTSGKMTITKKVGKISTVS